MNRPTGNLCRKHIDNALMEYELPRSEQAIRLLCMVAAHESGGFKYCHQISGPAVSIFQLEPASFYDVAEYARRRGYCYKKLPCHPDEMIFDVEFAAAMARIFFLRIPEPIPHPDDLAGLARYAKQYWNTEAGKASAEQYHQAYRKYFQT